MFALLDMIVSIGTLILPTKLSVLILISLFMIKYINIEEGAVMKNNQGVVRCDDCVGKPSYLFLIIYIEFCINMQRGVNPQPTPYRYART